MIKLDFDERDLRSLRVFCSVARAGGFAASEKELLMSKASISRHVREVEDRLGVRLCERGPAGFSLTPEGEVALKFANSALRSLERIRPEIDAVHGVLSGALSIGIGEHAVSHLDFKLPQALALLQLRAPKVKPEITVMTFTELDQALRENRVDIAIRGKYFEDNEFNYLPIYKETHRVYVSSLIKKQSSTKLPLVFRQHPYVRQAIEVHGYKRGPAAGGLDAIGVFIATGNYQGLLPTHLGDRMKDLRVQPDSPKFSHPICAVTDPQHAFTHRASMFLKILDELHGRIGFSNK
jgi:DNA-binding transcriptional LysR family regulator